MQIEALERRVLLSRALMEDPSAAAASAAKPITPPPAVDVSDKGVGHGKKKQPQMNPYYYDEVSQEEGDEGDLVPYAGTSGPAAPPLSGGVTEGIGFDSNASTAGYYFIPPDLNVATGPSHVVTVVNTSIDVYSKSNRSLLSRKRLGKNSTTATGSFFASLNPVNALFDAKVMYDQYNGRFVVVAMESNDTGSAATSTSRILVAVSATSDPTGTWYFGAINSKVTSGSTSYWADYPGLGLDSQALYVTANMFGFSSTPGYAGTRLWIIPKTGFYTGSAMTSKIYDPAGAAGLGSNTTSTLQPAHMYGTAPSGLGTFLVNSGWISGANDYLSVITVTNPLAASPTFANQFVLLGDVDNTSAAFPGNVPQLGSAQTLDGGDQRLQNAVWRNGFLYTANTVNPPSGPDAGQATAHWYKVNTSNLSAPTIADQGNVSGEDLGAGTRTFYPAVMVDAAGDVGLSFAAAGPSVYAGAYYTGRAPTDPAGTVLPTGTLAAGVDYYYRTFGGDRNRWGDYSGLALDPTDDATFWAFGEYAQARGTAFGGEDGRWGTRFAPFAFGGGIAGNVFSDNNSSNTHDGGEPGLASVTVYLDSNNNGAKDSGEPSATTDASGNYSFASLASGSYNVRVLVPAGYMAVTPALVVTAPPASGVDFGLFPTAFSGTTAGTNQFTLRLGSSPQYLEITRGSVPTIPPTWVAPVASLPALTFTTSGAGDALRLFMTNGAPLPSAGVTYNGSSAATLSVQGSTGADAVTLSSTALTAGGRTVTYAGPSTIGFDMLGGDDTVTINGTLPAGVALSLSLGTGNDTLALNSSALTLASDLAATSPTVTVNAASSTLLFNASQHLAALNLSGSSTATLAAGGNRLLVLGALSVTGTARLDLSDNDMVVDPTLAPPGGGTLSATQLRLMLQTAYASGAWTGVGVMSTTAKNNAAHTTGLGYATAGQLGISTYAGQSVSTNALIVKYTYLGDANLDGRVNGDDFALFDRGRAKGLTGWVSGDFNYDGVIDTNDRTLIDKAYGAQGGVL